QPRADITGALQQMLDACERTNDGGPFRSVAGSNAWHIVPRSGSVLDARITLPRAERTVGETINAILAAARASNGKRVDVGTAPINWMLRTKVTTGAEHEPARAVLARVLENGPIESSWDARTRVLTRTATSLSWQLLYDFGADRYALNLRSVI